jgi:TonB family protein
VEKSSDLAVMAYVAAAPGAIGYVAASTPLESGVREIQLGDEGGMAFDPNAVFDGASVDVSPKARTAPAIRYPARLRRRGVEGDVVVAFVVGMNGRPERSSISVVSTPHEQFSAAATELVLQSTFEPGRKGGRDVRVRVEQVIRFTLRNDR